MVRASHRVGPLGRDFPPLAPGTKGPQSASQHRSASRIASDRPRSPCGGPNAPPGKVLGSYQAHALSAIAGGRGGIAQAGPAGQGGHREQRTQNKGRACVSIGARTRIRGRERLRERLIRAGRGAHTSAVDIDDSSAGFSDPDTARRAHTAHHLAYPHSHGPGRALPRRVRLGLAERHRECAGEARLGLTGSRVKTRRVRIRDLRPVHPPPVPG
jgi:hypothetical protein